MQKKLKTEREIAAWLDLMNIKQFSLFADQIHGFTVTVHESVDLMSKNFNSIPIQFDRIEGDFFCCHNQLTTLAGSPHIVRGAFYCSHNMLTDLLHSPHTVNEYFCSYNRLTSLLGAPEIVHGDFNCSFNSLTSLHGCPKIVKGDFKCSYNDLGSVEFLPQSVRGDFDCEGNRDLAQIQDLSDFSEIKKRQEIYLAIKSEQKALSNAVQAQTSKPPSSYKI